MRAKIVLLENLKSEVKLKINLVILQIRIIIDIKERSKLYESVEK